MVDSFTIPQVTKRLHKVAISFGLKFSVPTSASCPTLLFNPFTTFWSSSNASLRTTTWIYPFSSFSCNVEEQSEHFFIERDLLLLTDMWAVKINGMMWIWYARIQIYRLHYRIIDFIYTSKFSSFNIRYLIIANKYPMKDSKRKEYCSYCNFRSYCYCSIDVWLINHTSCAAK